MFSLLLISNTSEFKTITPSEVLDLFLKGINLTSIDGKTISEEDIQAFIDASTQFIERYLSIKIFKQIISESRNYIASDFAQWGEIRTTYPIRKPFLLEGVLNKTKQLEYPTQWLSSKKSNQGQYYRKLSIIPNQDGMVTSLGAPFYGRYPFNLVNNYTDIPDYWRVTYLTGYSPEEIPADLRLAIGKLAAVEVLNILNNFILGPGIVGSSLSIDGLSQSIQTSKSAQGGAFGNMISQYLTDLKDNLLPSLKSYYKEFNMVVA